MIDVVYFVFDPDSDSDVSLSESAASLGAQDFPPQDVHFSILATAEAGIDDDFVAEHFAGFVDRVTVVPVESDDYSQNKLAALGSGDADIIAFADSDVIYRPDWLRRIARRLADPGPVVGLTGPPRFKRGSPLRTTLLLADFGLLWEDRHTYAPHVNLHNFAIRRHALADVEHAETLYHRFGAPSFITRRVRASGQRIALDQRHVVVHGLNWRIWLGEKRMRRYAHAARMAETDRLACDGVSYGARSTKPLSWLPLWWRWARRYQRRVASCAESLGFKRRVRILQRFLLAGLSAWELAQILFLAAFRPALHRMARRHDWW